MAGDALDEVVDDTRRLLGRSTEVIGLPLTGRVLRLARYLESEREVVLSHYGLSVADFDVLATIRRRAGDSTLNVRRLQQSMMLSSGGTTKRLDRLEEAGLIERHPDPGDRRGVLIGLSKEGQRVITDALTAITEAENRSVVRAIGSADERERVARGLRKMLVTLEAPNEPE